MSSKLKEYFNNMNKFNKIGHAFLIGNTTLEEIEESLNSIISYFLLHEETDIKSCVDVYIVSPSSAFITKDQMLELQENLKTTSQIHDKKIYIISECEKLNPQAANSLLKILEEPEPNIFAFLITGNINKVMETIKSRCQVLFLASSISQENIYQNLDESLLINIIDFIKQVEEKKCKSIAYVSNIFDKNIEKKDFKKIFNIVEYFYMDCLNYFLHKKIEYFINDEDLIKEITSKNTIKSITDKILILNSILNKMDYNLNINLLLDKIIIEFGRCEYA